MPVRQPDSSDPTRVFRSVRVGDLAEIFLLDIRSRRDEPALEPRMSKPDRSMLGAEQRDWLVGALDASDAAWRLVATPSLMTRTWMDGADGPLRTALHKLKLMDEDGQGPDEDQWDGYPAERGALLESFRDKGDVVVLSADIHVSIAAELHQDGAGVVAPEVIAPSLTSQNLDEKLGVEPRGPEVQAAERAFVDAHGHVHWCDMASHGYVVVDVDRERVRAEWWHLDGVLARLPGERCAATYRVERGSPRLVADPA
jgi:alkaline phosphatase D